MNNRSILFQQGSVKSKIGFRNIPMDSDLCTNDFQCMQLIKPKRKEPIFSSLFPTLFGKSFFTQFIVFVIFFGILPLGLNGQTVYPVRVSTQPIIGASVYLGDFTNPLATANKLKFTLTLEDPVETQRTVYFRLVISQNGTIIASNPIGFRGAQVTLERNTPLQINGEDLAENLSINNLQGLTGSYAYGVLNEGITDVCLEVIDAFREEPISRRACATGYLARLQAPILILPIYGSNIFEAQLNNLIFTWQMTDPLAHIPSANINYLFELREKSPQLDPQDQFENHTLIFSTVVDKFSVFYNELTSQLEPGKTYLWGVTAQFYDQLGNPAQHYFVNNGISRVGLFNVLPDINISGEESGISCFCPEGECDPFFPEISAPNRNLTVGDSVKVGAFYMHIDQLDGAGSGGTGSIRIPFINTNVAVTFSNIAVNRDFVATQGTVNSIRSSLVQGISIDADNLPDLSNLNVNNEWLNQMAQHVNQNLESYTLPVSLGNRLAQSGFNMPFEVFIIELAFNIFGAATTDLLISIPTINGEIINYGASEVRIGRNGFELAGLQLYQLNNANISGIGSNPIQLLRSVSEEPSVGSFISFNCNGMQQINVQSTFEFPMNQFINSSQPNQPVIANTTLTGETWGQFIGSGSISDFEAVGAPGWRFHSNQFFLDLNQNSNPNGISFPEGYDNNGTSWQGFYIPQADVHFPSEISQAIGNSSTFQANHILIDPQGVNCQAAGTNVLSLNEGNVGGWPFAIDSINLRINHNQFVDAHINGLFGIETTNSELSYQGLIFKNSDNNYLFDLSPIGALNIPFFKLESQILTGSQVIIEKNSVTQLYKAYADLNLEGEIHLTESDFINTGLSAEVAEIKTLIGSNLLDINIDQVQLNHFQINHPDLPIGQNFRINGHQGGQVAIPGTSNITLSNIQILEQQSDFNGINLPGAAFKIDLRSGSKAFDVGIWAKDQNDNNHFQFGKFTLSTQNINGLAFNCNCTPLEGNGNINYCDPINLTGGTTTSLQVNDIVNVGHFRMTITQLQGLNIGSGKMEIPFLNQFVEVNFNNVVIHIMPNGEKRLFSGNVVTVRNALMGDFNPDIANSPSPLNLTALNIDAEFMGQIENMSGQNSPIYTMPYSLTQVLNNSFNDPMQENVEFILLGVKFGPQEARYNSLLTFKIPDGAYMKFGLSGGLFRPDGFSLEALRTYLGEDINIEN